MSLLTAPEARALIATGLSDSELGVVIDREEAWLARIVGALSGSRVQTFWIGETDLDDPLLLQRPTTSVVVTDAGIAVDASAIRLLGSGTIVEKATGAWTGPSVTVTYTPDDSDDVKRVLVDLVRSTITASPYVSERIGDYGYTRGSEGTSAARSVVADRLRLARSLLPHLGPKSARVRSGAWSGRIGEAVST